MHTQLLAQLNKRADITVIENAPMAAYTTFQIGGPADIMIVPESAEGFAYALQTLHKSDIPTTVIGAGSNLLVADAGIRGAVVCPAKKLTNISVSDNTITAEAGISLARLAATALSAGLSGLEFAGGIPGSLGGAVFMNAGAYGGEMKQVVVSTEYLETDGTIGTVSGDDHAFSYRTSIFAKTGRIVLRSRMNLVPKDANEIRKTMQDFNQRRRDKQPLQYPSAGSFFKRPEGHFAGALIEQTGLKGLTVGGAQVSEKHAGFVINIGGATARDVCKLMELVKQKVYENTGVMLEPEVRFLGDFSN